MKTNRHPEWGAYAGPGDSWDGYPGHPETKRGIDIMHIFSFALVSLVMFIAAMICYPLFADSPEAHARVRALEEHNNKIVEEMGRKFDICRETFDLETCRQQYSAYFILPSGDVVSPWSYR